MSALVRAIASFFYVGYFPKAPGTVASFAGIFLAWFLNPALPFLFFFLCVVGFVVSGPAVSAFSDKDPSKFVLDEVCGAMLSVLWLPKVLWLWAVALVAFRVLDIQKPWIVGTLERQKSPLSIMWDDLAAGVLVNLSMQVVVLFTRVFIA